MSDLLDMDYINSLPQPIYGRMLGDKNNWWPVIDFEVGTGLMHIDVCGKSQLTHVREFASFMDICERKYQSDALYSDATQEDRVCI